MRVPRYTISSLDINQAINSSINPWRFQFQISKLTICLIPCMYIKTHGRVLAAKKAMWWTSVLFTGVINSPFSTPHTPVTTRLIFIIFTHFMSSIYTTLYIPNNEGNRPSSLKDMCSWILSHFPFFFFFAPFYKNNFEPTKDTLLVDRILSNLAHP